MKIIVFSQLNICKRYSATTTLVKPTDRMIEDLTTYKTTKHSEQFIQSILYNQHIYSLYVNIISI